VDDAAVVGMLERVARLDEGLAGAAGSQETAGQEIPKGGAADPLQDQVRGPS
jgi:hypothetical protein